MFYALREARGLSVDELAEGIGMDRSTIYRWERTGLGNPKMNTLLALQRALRLHSIEQLFGGYLECPSETLASRRQARATPAVTDPASA